jgi:hypothetical protein
MTAPPRPPFVAEPIEGWRVWQLGIHPRGYRPQLIPAGAGRGWWPARRALEARCYVPREVPTRHFPPTVRCTCGVYASDSLTSFLKAGAPGRVSVIGQISLWGKVIEHEHGWRAQYAYPSRLRLICAVCLQRGSGEATPYVVHASSHRSVIAACRWHRDEIPGGHHLDPDVVQAELLSAYAVDLLPVEALRKRFSFPQPKPTMYELGWPALQELRALSREVPPSEVTTAATGGTSSGAPASASDAPVVPTPAGGRSPVVRRESAPASEPLVLRALKAMGVGIAWLLQAAFFLLLFFVGCADTFRVVSVQP